MYLYVIDYFNIKLTNIDKTMTNEFLQRLKVLNYVIATHHPISQTIKLHTVSYALV